MKFHWYKNLLACLLILPIALLVLFPGGCSDFTSGVAPAPTVAPTAVPKTTTISKNTINVSSLPPEGRTTLQLIKKGGPFPYSKDGAVFSNFEGLLPKKPSGYYHEYTVVTPGENDRGARRIVAGEGGEYYYTDNHYASFKLIQE